MNVFIIHSDADAKFVETLSEALTAAGVNVFRRSEASRAGDNVLDQVTRDHDDVRCVIVVISGSFLSAGTSWTAHEISTWMLKEALGDQPVILPVLVEECDVPSFLSDHLYFDFRDAFDGPLKALIRTITGPCGDEGPERHSRTGTFGRNVSHQLQSLRDSFALGKLTLFCGAGVSMSAGIPGWKVFLRRLLSDLFVQHQTLAADQGESPKNLAKIYQEYFELSPIIVAQYLKNALGRDFQKTVRDALYVSGLVSSPLINAICELCRPQRERQALHGIVNFNFDDLIEQSLERNKIKHLAIFMEGQRPTQSELPIYHVHGYLPQGRDPDTTADIVFSEDAYHSKFIDPFSWSNLTQLNQLNHNTCLFLGLGMTDPNLRRLLDVAMRKNPDKTLNHYIFKKRYDVDDLAKHMARRNGLSEVGKHAGRLVRMAEILEERDCNNLGLNVIWVDDFDDIPSLINKISEA